MIKSVSNSFTVHLLHINIRYLFIRDKIERVEVNVHYYPTHLILSYCFTEPLMSIKFSDFRKIVMG